MNLKPGFIRINFENEGGAGGGGAAGAIAGAGGNQPPSGGTPAGFAWPSDLDTGIVDTLKSKGMWDDPAKGAVALAKSYTELNRLHSGASDVIAVPKADAPQADWDKFYGKLRPEAPDKYDVKFAQGVSELPPRLADFTKKLAHTWGVPQARLNAGIAMIQQHMADENATGLVEARTASEAAVAKIKQDMGEEKFNTSVANAQKVFKALKGQGLISDATMQAVEATIGARPLIELMAALGQRMGGEGSFLQGNNTPPPTDPTQMTAEQAKAEQARLLGDKDGFMKSYLDAKHPEHKNSVERMAALFEAQHRHLNRVA